ncbi:MAG: DNA polymerase I, partial [Acetobacteraceae bacterium]|nr:DNA polymerase I [Acetobacteraceae bacterium]
MADDPVHLILIDGSGFIFRAFHALPPMNRADGTPVNAVFGFTNMLAKLLRDQGAGTEVQSGMASFTHLAVIFDAGRTTFRNRIYDSYKATRPPPPDDLLPQFALVRDATAAFGVPAVELDDWEADDLIASYAREVTEAGGRVTIISSDKDLMQLLRPGVAMLDPIKQKPIGDAEVLEKFGVTPDRLIDVQALIGDKIDNVPGVPGIGPKNAAQLLAEFGDLETVLAAAPAMKPSKRRDMLLAHAENARLSRKLVTLRHDAPLPAPLADLAARQPDRATLGDWLAKMGFRSVLTRLGLDDPGGAPVQVQPRAVPQGPGEPATEVKAIEAAHPVAAFGPYETITTAEEWRLWLAEGASEGRFVLHAIADDPDPMRATLIGLAVARRPGRAAYLPLRHAELTAEQVAPETALALLAPLIADPHVLKIMPDAKRVLALLGAPTAAAVDDPLLMSYSLDAGLHGHTLEELSPLHLEHTPAGLDAVTGTGRARLRLIETAPERMTPHAAEAADIALRLWLTLRPRLRTGS